MGLFLSVLLCAAPLQVRVLEREQRAAVTVEAAGFRCDGAPLDGTVLELTAADRRIRAGTARACDEVRARGPVLVRAGELERRYDGELAVVNEKEKVKLVLSIDVERYLPSVVTAEARGLPAEALAAQAVVSRTFALASRKRHAQSGYDVCDLAHCQVYRGDGEADEASKAAVQRTANQVLLVGGVRLAPAFFHAACGGGTATASDVFGERGAGLPADDAVSGHPRCEGTAGYQWTFEVSRTELARAVGAAPLGPAFEVLRRDAFGRALQVRSFGTRLSGNEFLAKVGRVFGYSSLKSLVVTVSELDDLVTFTGRGIGHGVGLCQRGAAASAATGEAWGSILKRYFPDCRVLPAP
ncbi:MAG: SpoIID/LytB domain-containing protein [Myxococcaceae bacterium]|nr:SpoIID/LytB domain-containing protein [Myxococcaceae bacterium]